MGVGSSSISQLTNNTHLKKFVSAESISPNDPFWNQFLSFSFNLPHSSSDHRILEESVATLYRDLVINNTSSGNISALISVFLVRATELKASAQCDNSIFTWQAHNALFIIRCVTKLLMEHMPEQDVLTALQHPPTSVEKDEVTQDDTSHLVESLLTSLVEVIVDVPLSDQTYSLHLEATTSLLVFTSSHIFASGPVVRLIVFRNLMAGKASIHACLLVKTLLKRFIAQDKQPITDESGSIILGLASGIWSVLTLGLSSATESEPSRPNPVSPLASQGVHLLLILSNHCTAEKGLTNPYREALLNAQNFQDPAEPAPTKATATFKLEFTSLYTTLCKQHSNDQTTLLLYLLLHKNMDFRSYILARTDIENLILPILQTLYNAPDSTSHHIYMSLIILLILSEDDSFNKTIHDITLKPTPWYTERAVTDLSLGGLLILVVIRTITYNMTKMRDKYLHTNCLAALANMSSQFRNLHPYVCQRIVSLFETLSKRHTRLSETLQDSSQLLDESEDISDVMSDVSVLEEILRMVLEIINCALVHQLSHNHNLLYTLLYNKELFHHYSDHASFQDITLNIETILNFLMMRLETTTPDPGVRDVQEAIQQGLLHLPKDRLKKFAELKFKYVEENEPEEFFIPYVWTLVYNSSGLYWNPDHISLFDPLKPADP